MATRRERKEARVDRRREWAAKAAQRSEQRFDAAHQIMDGIPLGQPILVGHHSEKRARKDVERIDTNMRKAIENDRLAAHHRSVASGIEHQLDTSVYSDDVDAVERLEARIAEREAQAARMKQINAAIRKGDGWADRISPPLTPDEWRDLKRAAQFDGSAGYPTYALSNLRATIRRDQQRLLALRAASD